MPRRTFDATARLGVNIVESIVTKVFRWIWREQPITDFGIDGHIEPTDQDKRPTGKLVAVQIKTGASYFRGRGETIPFYVDEEHLKYWDRHILPVVIILHNPEDDQTLWQWADLSTARKARRGWCIDIPKENTFGAASKDKIQGNIWADDSVSLRRRFALDRQFMKKFENQEAFVTIPKWVHHHLQYREIEIRLDDPSKEPPDYKHSIMANWDYEISDIMQHFYPWLEFWDHEAPDNEDFHEVAIYVLTVRLSKMAKAFLELEAFFENPSQDPQNQRHRNGSA